MPLPFQVERPDPVSANWRIGTAPPCSRGCDALIAEIETSLWPKYDLLESAPDVRAGIPTTESTK
jgi:hypothetical protein